MQDCGNYPFPARFKWHLNISVAAAGFRLLLCRFCAFPLSVWAIPVVGSGWLGRLSSSGAGAVVSAAGEALLPGRDGGVPGGSGKTGGVFRAGYRAIYPHPLSLSKNLQCSCGRLCRGSLWGVAEKGGGGFYVEHYENNWNPLYSLDEICLNEVGGIEPTCLLCQMPVFTFSSFPVARWVHTAHRSMVS